MSDQTCWLKTYCFLDTAFMNKILKITATENGKHISNDQMSIPLQFVMWTQIEHLLVSL